MTSNGLNSIYFTNDNIGYIVGDYGTILKTYDGSGGLDIKSYIYNSQNLNIFPNPSSTFIKLDITLDNNSYYSIYNILGEAQIINIPSQQNIIDVSFLSTGLYFITYYQRDSIYIGKFVKK